jgi:hypothetical protein
VDKVEVDTGHIRKAKMGGVFAEVDGPCTLKHRLSPVSPRSHSVRFQSKGYILRFLLDVGEKMYSSSL